MDTLRACGTHLLVLFLLCASCSDGSEQPHPLDAALDVAYPSPLDAGPDVAAPTPIDAAPDVADPCPAVDPGAYGDCGLSLGAAYDGERCVFVSGCDCAPDCALFHPSRELCAQACAATGGCNENVVFAYPVGTPFEPGIVCDY